MMKNILILILISFVIFSCKKKEEKVGYKLSEDICLVCTGTPYNIMSEDTVQIRSIITPNSDIFNDFIEIRFIDTLVTNIPNNLTIYDRDGNEIIHFEDYKCNWPTYIPSQREQDVEGLINGLYKFILTRGIAQRQGYFIILLQHDSYLDKHVYELPCFNDCMYIDSGDPFFIY